jgi:hypothetical protein
VHAGRGSRYARRTTARRWWRTGTTVYQLGVVQSRSRLQLSSERPGLLGTTWQRRRRSRRPQQLQLLRWKSRRCIWEGYRSSGGRRGAPSGFGGEKGGALESIVPSSVVGVVVALKAVPLVLLQSRVFTEFILYASTSSALRGWRLAFAWINLCAVPVFVTAKGVVSAAGVVA